MTMTRRLGIGVSAWALLALAGCGSGGDSDEADGMPADLGEGDGSDVVTIGDSWMNLFVGGIEQSLEEISGRDYRNYAVPGTRVLNGQIPSQYDAAVVENDDIKTVVMTGGGNDILFSPCVDDECDDIVEEVADALEALLLQMGDDGVEDVIMIGYAYPDDAGKHASLDRSRAVAEEFCTPDTMPRCHFLDASTLDIALRDGIHPDDAGYDLLGDEVWQLLQEVGARR